MMWLGVYQSARCWLFSLDCTTRWSNFTSPHAQIGGRPIDHRIAPIIAKSRMAISALNLLIRSGQFMYTLPVSKP